MTQLSTNTVAGVVDLTAPTCVAQIVFCNGLSRQLLVSCQISFLVMEPDIHFQKSKQANSWKQTYLHLIAAPYEVKNNLVEACCKEVSRLPDQRRRDSATIPAYTRVATGVQPSVGPHLS